MGPEVDVGALAAGSGLLELDLGLLLVLDFDLYAGFLRIALGDLGEGIVVIGVARPDGKERIDGAVLLRECGECGNRGGHGGRENNFIHLFYLRN